MSIIILILKIIGIVLLILLALIALIGILVLAVPARYRIEGCFSEEKKAFSVRITWLLRAVSFMFYSGESGIEKKITIFGFRLKAKKKDNTNIKDKSDRVEENAGHAEVAGKSEKGEEAVGQNEEVYEAPHEDSGGFETDKESVNRKGFFQKIADKINGIIQKNKGIYNKILETVKKAQDFSGKVKEFITDAGNKTAFGKIKKEIFYLIKHFKPRKIEGRLLFGTGDPATTGYILSGFYAIYQGLPLRLDVTPDFENKVIDGDIMIKGRIRSVHALLVIIRLFGSKEFRRMLKFRKRFAKKNNI